MWFHSDYALTCSSFLCKFLQLLSVRCSYSHLDFQFSSENPWAALAWSKSCYLELLSQYFWLLSPIILRYTVLLHTVSHKFLGNASPSWKDDIWTVFWKFKPDLREEQDQINWEFQNNTCRNSCPLVFEVWWIVLFGWESISLQCLQSAECLMLMPLNEWGNSPVFDN